MPSIAPTLSGFAEFCFPCVHVLHRERPVRHIYRDGSDWMFTCGEGDHSVLADWAYAHTIHLLEADDSIRQLADLRPDGQAARYNTRSAWLRLQL